MASSFDHYEGMLDAKRRVETSQSLNNQIFAFYAANPIIVSTEVHQNAPEAVLQRHRAHLDRIAPWLPRYVPHWMRAPQ